MNFKWKSESHARSSTIQESFFRTTFHPPNANEGETRKPMVQFTSVVIWVPGLAQHTIRIVKFLSKNLILTKPQHFHEFFTHFFFWPFFSWNQSCQQLKCSKPQHFHEFYTKIIDNFLGKSKLNFWTKNEGFEQCALCRLQSQISLSIKLLQIPTAKRASILVLKIHTTIWKYGQFSWP